MCIPPGNGACGVYLFLTMTVDRFARTSRAYQDQQAVSLGFHEAPRHPSCLLWTFGASSDSAQAQIADVKDQRPSSNIKVAVKAHQMLDIK